MKAKLKSFGFLMVYLALYATLWLTFFNGFNIYMDRFQDFMTAVYIFTNSIFCIVVLSMWIILAIVDKDLKLKESMREMATNDKMQDFMKMKQRHGTFAWRTYRYLAFYPAIFCAGILLGHFYLASAMLFDVIILSILRSQIEDLKLKVT